MAKALVTVIIPVYNTEKFIDECLQSVCGQTYDALEILLSDDGSVDNSVDLCRKWEANDNRVRLLLPEDGKNHGVSTARNIALDAAKGEFVLFIDSDDMIHPEYVEWIVEEMNERKADFAGFSLIKVKEEADFEKIKEFDRDLTRGTFEYQDAAKFEATMSDEMRRKWQMMAIGGKCVRMSSIGNLRFKTDMKYGEDTLFIQELALKGANTLHGVRELYYYRIHGGNAIVHKYESESVDYVRKFFEIANRLSEEKKYNAALMWQTIAFNTLRLRYDRAKKNGNKEWIKEVKALSKELCRQPFYKTSTKARRFNYLMYRVSPETWVAYHNVTRIKNDFIINTKNLLKKTVHRVGILTFHCADNYGAMLQSYGLKTFISSLGFETDIINYSPVFMTGRHWFFTYYPEGGIKKRLKGMYRAGRRNWGKRADFLKQRENMRSFRMQFVKPEGRKLLKAKQLKRHQYDTYVLGSDQIWNPDLTYGLRPEYFGSIHRGGDRAVAYAASFGGGSLNPKYEAEFGKLVSKMSAVSMRESSAVEWVQQFYTAGKVTSVCDPVFLPDADVWNDLIKAPKTKVKPGEYVLVYSTETKPELEKYALEVAEKKGLRAVILSPIDKSSKGFITDKTAGPSEFLWYIKNADCVVSNSFHALSFSVILHKKFVAFLHSNRSNRLQDMLKNVGLVDKIVEECGKLSTDVEYSEDELCVIDKPVDWTTVDRKIKDLRKSSETFLFDNLYVESAE